MKIHDISRSIFTGMPHWPGDTPAEFALTSTLAGGSTANVGRLAMCIHTGTHADAPFHYNQAGAKIDEVPLEIFVGPASVVDVRGHAIISPALLTAQSFLPTPRVLFKSDHWANPTEFPGDWPLLTPDMPAWLAEHGVQLIGLDVPSVDHLKSQYLPIHHALDAAGIIILENLDLSAVVAGTYELIALPLKICAGDGSPIRAILRSRD